ncbi:DUF4185 domain-containing protein [Microlunatus parietis]|uniref:DUF4185 domain-containing protein n=1 Tax=Microlunatus parietis TaxID=682979 RepID=A0A7Y9I2T7_9ACTN|nr:DUF4185 domain-containing protein [Microlunatus parietis]NYE69010.1 hypothetical protein [Microlunatus parietis]
MERPTIHRRAVLTAGVGLAAFAALGQRSAGAVPKDGEPTAVINERLTRLFGDYADTAGAWTGADSAYSVPLPDGRTAWLYSDTFLGTVNPDGSRPLDSPFIHNSIIVQDRDRLATITGGTPGAPRSLVAPAGADESKTWYWFGDGTVEGRRLRVLLLEFEKTGDGPFDFAFKRTAIASFALPDVRLETITPLPEPTPDLPLHWASAVVEQPDHTYVFGVEDRQAEKYAHLARVRPGHLTRDPWQYFTGDGWSGDPTASARILAGVSNEFSVSRHRGRWLLITGDAREPLSADIVAYRSASLTGGYGEPIKLYRTPETGGNVFTYNAKAHPQLTRGGTVVITYNVNSFESDDLYADARLYRPRYVDVSFS